ncbi:hypothetical protein BATDEDRAFT_24047 [Batrachochytrium dendrobatidis JAM81]|uniref:Uncharacterized protein n=2 Tax=Batrachochytrium dendrobatidis TaxID=109871 RepID=F4NZS0_BATDJ|nr:uncharacterized protein BATDEDRAFT_24047 [Batrachochytrium dendrobatidis JAM81]EGF81234.1 hypothetical protein BATDEDRAFT_24047 [Batrachochytrium dendrobatidis JAM81]OAJ38244.1 hypothetical protein BDEG_22193 [Batrachochytrium dendrobatidis JEL423]|eukprot:XP_006677897.1 hypothetical protein BATDEDRAFT_24047 [Batrachochytrium dendrobatidis JAM81]
MNGRRLSVYTNMSSIQDLDPAAVSRMWALEDQLVTTQDFLAEQLEARKQLERELANSKLEIDRMRTKLTLQTKDHQLSALNVDLFKPNSSGADIDDVTRISEVGLPGRYPLSPILDAEVNTNLPQQSIDASRQAVPNKSSFFSSFRLAQTSRRKSWQPVPFTQRHVLARHPSFQNLDCLAQDNDSEITYDDISDELTVARQMNFKYQKDLISLHDALDISLQFVLNNAEKVIWQSQTELLAIQQAVPEIGSSYSINPRPPLKWQDFWPMEYVERSWDQDSEYDSDVDMPPQDRDVKGDHFAWWRFQLDNGAFQGMRSVRRKISHGWELAQVDAKLADAAQEEKIRLKMQRHHDMHFKYYHSRPNVGHDPTYDTEYHDQIDLFDIEDIDSDDDVYSPSRPIVSYLAGDGNASHTLSSHQPFAIDTESNRLKDTNFKDNDSQKSDVDIGPLSQKSFELNNPAGNLYKNQNTSSPQGTISKQNQPKTMTGMASSLFSQTASWLKASSLAVDTKFVQRESLFADSSDTPKLGWFENEDRDQPPRSENLKQLRQRDSMLGLRWNDINELQSTPIIQRPLQSKNTDVTGSSVPMQILDVSNKDQNRNTSEIQDLGKPTDPLSRQSWLKSFQSAIATTKNSIANAASLPIYASSTAMPLVPTYAVGETTTDSLECVSGAKDDSMSKSRSTSQMTPTSTPVFEKSILNSGLDHEPYLPNTPSSGIVFKREIIPEESEFIE